MIANSPERVERMLDQLQDQLRERVGKSSNIKLTARENVVVVEGRVPTYYLKQIVLNMLARGLPCDIDAHALVVE